jgi:hypothetical protein
VLNYYLGDFVIVNHRASLKALLIEGFLMQPMNVASRYEKCRARKHKGAIMKYNIFCKNLKTGHECQMSLNDILNVFPIQELVKGNAIDLKRGDYKYRAEKVKGGLI